MLLSEVGFRSQVLFFEVGLDEWSQILLTEVGLDEWVQMLFFFF